MMKKEIAAAAKEKKQKKALGQPFVYIKPDVRLMISLKAVENLEKPDLQSLYLALLNAKFDNLTTLWDAYALNKEGKPLKSFGLAIGTEYGQQIQIFRILAGIFKWFPQPPPPKNKE